MKVTFHSYWRMPEALWRRFQRLIPKWHPSPKGGRPPLDARRVADGIYYVLRTGCPWKAAPREFGSGSALHNYFQQWQRQGVFHRLWKQGLAEYDHRQRVANEDQVDAGFVGHACARGVVRGDHHEWVASRSDLAGPNGGCGDRCGHRGLLARPAPRGCRR